MEGPSSTAWLLAARIVAAAAAATVAGLLLLFPLRLWRPRHAVVNDCDTNTSILPQPAFPFLRAGFWWIKFEISSRSICPSRADLPEGKSCCGACAAHHYRCSRASSRKAPSIPDATMPANHESSQASNMMCCTGMQQHQSLAQQTHHTKCQVCLKVTHTEGLTPGGVRERLASCQDYSPATQGL